MVYALAMALLEAAVVIYLRELYYPAGFLIRTASDISIIPPRILNVELWREAVTIIMLLAVAYLAYDSWKNKFLAFLFAFSVWDIAYYLFLYVFLRWPSSPSTLDIYFLIPRPWIGPVWFPLVLFGIITIFTLRLLIKTKYERN